MSLAEIKTAIERLSFEERAELAAWLHGWKDDEWDEQRKRTRCKHGSRTSCPATLPLRSAGIRLLPAQITNLKNRCTAVRSRIERVGATMSPRSESDWRI